MDRGELGISPGEPAGLHCRFEVVPGAQAQVDWGDEGQILARVGIPKDSSFFNVWLPLRRAKSHGTHGEVIRHRVIRDHMALRPLPTTPYVVAQRHLRYVGKDFLVAFGANLYSVPACQVRPRRLVEVRATKYQLTLHSSVPGVEGDTLPATHSRAVGRGACIVDEKHWDGLPDGRNRRTITGDIPSQPRHQDALGEELAIRDDRRFCQDLRLSKLPHHKTLDE